MAQRLGKKPGIITSVGDDFKFHQTFEEKGIPVYNQKSKHTTVFENIYKDKTRRQFISARADNIIPDIIRTDLRNIPIVHLGAIADEIDYSICELFPDSLIGGDIQGSLRTWDKSGLVSTKNIDWNKLSGLDILVVSENDVKGIDLDYSELINIVPHIVITRGIAGATILTKSEEYHFPSFPVNEVDATGAGDTFTSAYLIEFERTGDIVTACIFAHCTASFIIEGVGINNLPKLDAINKRIEAYRRIYDL